jgi:ABC-type multidrug transport system ATPase subunit
MIVAKDLTKRYGSTLALDSVSFIIESGESVALWGANGAGKTTALRCFLGLHPFEGQLTVSGIDVSHQGKAARTVIGYVPQSAVFYDMTVRETLKFYARLKKTPLERVDQVLEHVKLSEQHKKSVHALSGGMKQRLALAVSLLSDPPILILDEPTANLDVQAQRDFVRMIQELNQMGKTIVFSSHRLDEVLALGQRVLVLDKGHLQIECTTTELPGKLGLRQWMRVEVPGNSHENAIKTLGDEGFAFVPNGKSIYIHTDSVGKMQPLRALEQANVPVKDFDMVDESMVPRDD